MRLIDADALSKLVGEPIEVFLRRLDLKLPPTVDAVEVVRCKDCKFYWKNSVMTNVPLCLASPREDAFCSDGERRED